MTRSQTVMRGKTVFLSSDGHILCDCPGETPGVFSHATKVVRKFINQHQQFIATLGLSPSILDEDSGVVPSGEKLDTVDSSVSNFYTFSYPSH
jgi:hypothetical protein